MPVLLRQRPTVRPPRKEPPHARAPNTTPTPIPGRLLGYMCALQRADRRGEVGRGHRARPSREAEARRTGEPHDVLADATVVQEAPRREHHGAGPATRDRKSTR